MIRTFLIDDSTEKSKELLEYLSTLDFVQEEINSYTLTDDQISIVEERRMNRQSGKSKSKSWEEVKKDLGS
ncbi:MAG: hypothetical protein KDC84_04630 [Crocinitomicaceae bacterium]|nr:hypothetical protein [Crocinitomicaceae bacterium]